MSVAVLRNLIIRHIDVPSTLRGNLSVRSLADVVHKEDFADLNSEYLETLLVAVPK